MSTSVVVPTVCGGAVTVVAPPPHSPPGHDVTVIVDVVYVVSWYVL